MESSRGADQEQTRFLVLQVQPPPGGPENVGAVLSDVHDQLVKTWSAPQSARVHSATQAMFSHVDGVEAHGYVRIPPVENCRCTSVHCVGQNPGLGYQPTLQAMQVDSPSGQQGLLLGWGGSLRPARYGGASSIPGQAPAVPGGQVRHTDAVNDLRAATDFALMATKRAAQAIGRAMGFMVVQQRHLWLTLADLRDADRKVLLNAPISSLRPLWRCRGVNRRAFFGGSKARQGHEPRHAEALVPATIPFQIVVSDPPTPEEGGKTRISCRGP